MQRIAGWIVSARWALLALALLTLLPALKVLPELRTNNNVDAFLAEGDPGLTFYRETTDRFGGDHVVYVAMEAGDGGVWTAAALGRLSELTGAALQVDGVHEVLSLVADGVPTDEHGIAALKARVERSPLLGRLVAPGDRATLLAVELDAGLIDDPTGETAAVVALREALTEADEGRRPRMAGNPVLAETIEANNVRDTNLFSGLMMLLVGLSTLVLLRRIGPALLPGLVVLVAVGWTIGWFVAAGNQTNWVTSIIAPILMLVGVADAVHFLARYQQELPEAGSRKEAVRRTLQAITLPCLFTSLTTAAGFASLVVNEVVPVRTFGIYAAIGVLLALVATLAVLPAVLAAGKGRKQPPRIQEGRFSALLAGVDRRVQARPALVVLLSLAVLLPLAAGAFFIQVETNLLKYFADDAPLVQDSLFIEEAWAAARRWTSSSMPGRRGRPWSRRPWRRWRSSTAGWTPCPAWPGGCPSWTWWPSSSWPPPGRRGCRASGPRSRGWWTRPTPTRWAAGWGAIGACSGCPPGSRGRRWACRRRGASSRTWRRPPPEPWASVRAPGSPARPCCS